MKCYKMVMVMKYGAVYGIKFGLPGKERKEAGVGLLCWCLIVDF